MSRGQMCSRVGVFSSQRAVRDLDGRTREAAIVKQTIADLTAQVGGSPSAAQALLIHATAVVVLWIRCALDKYGSGADIESLDKHFVSLQNSLCLNLVTLGLEATKERVPSLERYLEARRVAVATLSTIRLLVTMIWPTVLLAWSAWSWRGR